MLTSDGNITYTYGIDNRLESTSLSSFYFYDHSGRRTAKMYNNTTTYYIYDGDHVIAEYEVSGGGEAVLARKYIYGPGIDRPVAMIDVDGESENRYYYHTDALGSVVALSNSSGLLAESYKYSPYGKACVYDAAGSYTGESSAYGNPYMFTARRYDPETGLYYYRARMYSPKLGRFLQTDPLGYHDSMNLYQYCLNNPGNYTDPTGEGIVGLIKAFWDLLFTAKEEAEDIEKTRPVPPDPDDYEDGINDVCYESDNMIYESERFKWEAERQQGVRRRIVPKAVKVVGEGAKPMP